MSGENNGRIPMMAAAIDRIEDKLDCALPKLARHDERLRNHSRLFALLGTIVAGVAIALIVGAVRGG